MTKNPQKMAKVKKRKLRGGFSRKVMRLRTQDGGHMQNGLSLSFERNLYRAVVRFKAEHQELLDEKTMARKARESEEKSNGQMELREQR